MNRLPVNLIYQILLGAGSTAISQTILGHQLCRCHKAHSRYRHVSATIYMPLDRPLVATWWDKPCPSMGYREWLVMARDSASTLVRLESSSKTCIHPLRIPREGLLCTGLTAIKLGTPEPINTNTYQRTKRPVIHSIGSTYDSCDFRP